MNQAENPHREPAERPGRHRNLVIGAFRRKGFANIAHARRYYGRDDQRIRTRYGYAWRALLTGVTAEPVSGLEELRIDTGEAVISVSRGGAGSAVLLLHGFPQTKLIWRDIAPRLAQRFTVVCADLRGYGQSSTPLSSTDHAPYSKRAMARDMISVMAQLGFQRFFIAGHDRGGRVAYRAALDTRTGWTRSRSLTCCRSTPSGAAPTIASRSRSGHGRCWPSPSRCPNA